MLNCRKYMQIISDKKKKVKLVYKSYQCKTKKCFTLILYNYFYVTLYTYNVGLARATSRRSPWSAGPERGPIKPVTKKISHGNYPMTLSSRRAYIKKLQKIPRLKKLMHLLFNQIKWNFIQIVIIALKIKRAYVRICTRYRVV